MTTRRKPIVSVRKIELLVQKLADEYDWNWTRMLSERDAADAVLRLMAGLRLIRRRKHRFGGDIWITPTGLKLGRTKD